MWYDHPFSQRNNNRKSSGVGVGGNREEGEGEKNFKKWGVGNIGGVRTPLPAWHVKQQHMEHGTKTILLFLPVDGEVSWSLLPSSVSLLSGSTVQPESTHSCILRMPGQF